MQSTSKEEGNSIKRLLVYNQHQNSASLKRYSEFSLFCKRVAQEKKNGNSTEKSLKKLLYCFVAAAIFVLTVLH